MRIKPLVLMFFLFSLLFGQDKAFVIGINDYIKYSASNGDLRGCENDAQMFINLIKKQSPEVKVQTLYSRSATRKSILSKLKNISDDMKQGERFIFFYSGHGTTYPDKYSYIQDESSGQDVAICPSDVGMGGSYNGVILDDELGEIFETIRNKGADVLAFFDCCHSGSLHRSLGDEYRSRFIKVDPVTNISRDLISKKVTDKKHAFDFNLENNSRSFNKDKKGNMLYFGACSDKEVAWETMGNGVFTKTLVEKFRTSEFLDNYFKEVHSKIISYSKANFNSVQTPSLYVSKNYQNDFSIFPVDVQIIGLVKQTDGKPVKGAHVGVLRPGLKYSSNSQAEDYLVLAKTNSKGAFQLKGSVMEGRYNIKVVKEGFEKVQEKVEIKKGKDKYAPLKIVLRKIN